MPSVVSSHAGFAMDADEDERAEEAERLRRLKMLLEAACLFTATLGGVTFGAGAYASAVGGMFGLQSAVMCLGVCVFAVSGLGLVLPKRREAWVRLGYLYGALVLALLLFAAFCAAFMFRSILYRKVDLFWPDSMQEFAVLQRHNATDDMAGALRLVAKHCDWVGVLSLMTEAFMALGIFCCLRIVSQHAVQRSVLYFANAMLAVLGVGLVGWAAHLWGRFDRAGQSDMIPISLTFAGILLALLALAGTKMERDAMRQLVIPYCAALSFAAVIMVAALLTALLYASRLGADLGELSDAEFRDEVARAGLSPERWSKSAVLDLLRAKLHFVAFVLALACCVVGAVISLTVRLRGRHAGYSELRPAVAEGLGRAI